MNIKQAIDHVVSGHNLTTEQVTDVIGQIMQGQATAAQIGGFLIGLRMKGETADEIAGGATAMRNCAKQLYCPDPDHAVDTCGTGGDGSGSVNISTLAAIVAAGRRRARRETWQSLCIIESWPRLMFLRLSELQSMLPQKSSNVASRKWAFTFLFAPAFHAAMRHAAKPRKELGTRTLF